MFAAPDATRLEAFLRIVQDALVARHADVLKRSVAQFFRALEAEFAAAADALVAAAPARPFPAVGLLARVRRTVHPCLIRGGAQNGGNDEEDCDKSQVHLPPSVWYSVQKLQ